MNLFNDAISKLILLIYGINMKNVSKFIRNSMTKNRFSQHVQKTEHINWGWFGILYVAQRKHLPKFQRFSQEFTKSYRRLTFFY